MAVKEQLAPTRMPLGHTVAMTAGRSSISDESNFPKNCPSAHTCNHGWPECSASGSHMHHHLKHIYSPCRGPQTSMATMCSPELAASHAHPAHPGPVADEAC